MASKKNAVAHAAEVLVNAQPVAPRADDSDWVPGTEGFTLGRYKLADDPEVLQSTAMGCKATDAMVSTWAITADILHGKGIRAGMLYGKDVIDEVRAEVEDVITVIRFGNQIAAETAEGIKISMVADIKASLDPKSMHWKLMGESRRRNAKSAYKQVGTYLKRLIEQMQMLEVNTTAKPKVTKTIEERYLDLLGPVLLFLQQIDQTKQDPKFDWREEFDAISDALNRAKKAKALATC
jgi:hypothetical protein